MKQLGLFYSKRLSAFSNHENLLPKSVFKTYGIIIFMFFAQVSWAQELEGGDFLEYVDGKGFGFAYELKEEKAFVFLGGGVFLKRENEHLKSLTIPEGLSLGYDMFKDKKYRLVEKGNIIVLKGTIDGSTGLYQISVENETVTLIQDFKAYSSDSKFDVFSAYTISKVTPIIDGKVYCLVQWQKEDSFGFNRDVRGARHILSIDAKTGDWTNITESYKLDVDFEYYYDNVDYIDNFIVLKDRVCFIKTESRCSGTNCQYTKFISMIKNGNISTLNEFEKLSLSGVKAYYFNANPIVVFYDPTDYSNPNFGENAVIVNNNTAVQGEPSQSTFINNIKGLDTESPSKVYDGSTYFIGDNSIYTLNPDGNKSETSFVEGANIEAQVDGDFEGEALYFLADKYSLEGTGEYVGTLWMFNNSGWKNLKVETTNAGVSMHEKVVYVAGILKDETSELNIAGIYKIEDGEPQLEWRFKSLPKNLNVIDNTFYFHFAYKEYNRLEAFYSIPFKDNITDIAIAVASQNISAESSVEFADNTLGEISSREWIFEGGTPDKSTEVRPIVQYEEPGTYKVDLSINFSDGKVETQSYENYIEVVSRVSSTCTAPDAPKLGAITNTVGPFHASSLAFNWNSVKKESGELVLLLDDADYYRSPDTFYDRYEVMHRKFNSLDPWETFEHKTYNNSFGFGQASISNLEPDTPYEIKVRTICSDDEVSVSSDILLVKSGAPIPDGVQCKTNGEGALIITYRDSQGFDFYESLTIKYKHSHWSANDWRFATFAKGDPIVIYPGDAGYYEVYIKYNYTSVSQSAYVYKSPIWVNQSAGSSGVTGNFSLNVLSRNGSSRVIQFISMDSTGASTFNWDFDGATVIQNEGLYNPIVSFDANDFYTVSLTVTDKQGHAEQKSYENLIDTKSPPEIDVSVKSIKIGDDVTFEYTGELVDSIKWMFFGAEPGISISVIQQVKYIIGGDFDVKLMAYKDSVIEEYLYENVVQASSKSGGYPYVTLSNSFAETAEQIKVQLDENIELLSYEWIIDEGIYTSLSQKSFNIHWQHPGIYTINLAAKNTYGEMFFIKQNAEVYPSKTYTSIESIRDKDLNFATEVFPNITDGLLYVKCKSTHENNAQIKLLSLNGKQLHQQYVSTISFTTIDISTYEPGLYLLQIVSENRHSVYKVVKN